MHFDPLNKMVIPAVLCLLLFSNNYGQGTINKIPLPDASFKRVTVDNTSFAAWLRTLELKPPGSAVLDYRDRIYKSGSDSTVAYVTKMNISHRRMEQCMDILVRFYSEYRWQQSDTDDLMFPLPGGYPLYWSDWMTGLRPQFKGVQVSMKKTHQPDSSFVNFESYLRTIYAESHTQQFYHGYLPVDRQKLQIGDFVVSKGSKAHAVMIVDLAKDKKGRMVMLIGHGDTPACQFYILNYKSNQPWFPVDFEKEIIPLPIKRKMKWSGLRRFDKWAD